MEQVDADGHTPDNPLRLSAEYGHGLPALQHAVLSLLGLAAFGEQTPWAFSPTLQAWAAGDAIDLNDYLSPHTWR